LTEPTADGGFGSGSCGPCSNAKRAVLTRSFDYGAEMLILMKDIDLAVAQGEELGVPMWVREAARLVFKHAMDKGAAKERSSATSARVNAPVGFSERPVQRISTAITRRSVASKGMTPPQVSLLPPSSCSSNTGLPPLPVSSKKRLMRPVSRYGNDAPLPTQYDEIRLSRMGRNLLIPGRHQDAHDRWLSRLHASIGLLPHLLPQTTTMFWMFHNLLK
jgi:hypothetical protein